jgi:hypothetical protein
MKYLLETEMVQSIAMKLCASRVAASRACSAQPMSEMLISNDRFGHGSERII